MSMHALYQELITEHAKQPHHSGLREPFHAEVRHVNPTCGDEVTMRVRLAGDRIVDVSHHGAGCAISLAATSMMGDAVIGKTVEEALTAYDAFLELMHARGRGEPDPVLLEDAVALAGVARYPARIKCALLGWAALKDALARAEPGTSAGEDTDDQQ